MNSSILGQLKAQPPAPTVQDPKTIASMYRHWRVRIMYSTTAGYAVFYFVRNNMPMATKAIADEFHYSNAQLSYILSAATIVYAFSKFFSGVIGDRANPRYLLGLALLFSAGINFAFGFGASLGVFAALWALNSVFQGVGVPPCTRLLTFWYSPREIGRAWGIWNCSHQVGGAIIAAWAAWLVTHHGWRSAFWAPAIVGVMMSLFLMNRLRDSPESMGLPPVEEYRGEAEKKVESPSVPFWIIFKKHILTNRGVWIVSIANFFVYVVRIGILTWAPKFLVESKGFTLVQSSWSLIAFEVAGMVGAYASGWLSDTVFKGRRGPVSATSMLLLIVALLALIKIPAGQVVVTTGLFLSLGFLVYGPQMLVAVAAADFATKVASATAVGLTGLFGYIGATCCQLATGYLADKYGWNSALWLYAISAVIGFVLLATTWNQASPILKAAHEKASAKAS